MILRAAATQLASATAALEAEKTATRETMRKLQAAVTEKATLKAEIAALEEQLMAYANAPTPGPLDHLAAFAGSVVAVVKDVAPGVAAEGLATVKSASGVVAAYVAPVVPALQKASSAAADAAAVAATKAGPAARRDEGSRDDANARETNAANAQGPNSATKPREDDASPDPSHRSFVAASARAAELETSLERAKSEAESFRSLLAAARTSADASAAAGAGTFPEITRAVESVARELREEIRDAVAAAVADLSASASASGAPGGGGAGASPSSRGGGGYRDNTGSMMMPRAAAP